MKIAIVGAGQTGRGFLARLFAPQAELTLIDRDAALIDRLRAAGGYRVRFFDGTQPMRIEGYAALHTDDAACRAALKAADAVFVSVRPENLREAGEWLAARVPEATSVVACENAPLPAAGLGGGLDARAASGAIFCTTVNDGDIDIAGENYPSLFVSVQGSNGALGLSHIEYVGDFAVLMQRKLYTYNAASAIIAYLGIEKGFLEYADAANDPVIDGLLDIFYGEVNRAVCARYGVDEAAQRDFAALSKRKFQNRAIADSIERNAASPARKLGRDERIIAPALLIRAHGGTARPLIETAAAALSYLGARDEACASALLETHSDLPPDDALHQDIIKAWTGR